MDSTLPVQGPGFDLWSRNKIPHAATTDPSGCNEDQRSYLLQDVVQPPNAFFKQKKKIEPKSRKGFYALRIARVGEELGCHSL